MSIFFNGKTYVKPQGMSRIDTSEMATVSAGSTNRLVIIGQATGGQPGIILPFSDPVLAKDVLRSGDLLRASRLAWSPSPNLSGASVVNAVRINSAIQASNLTDLKDASSSVVLHAKSKDYGIWNNQIQFKVESASAKKATTFPSNITGVRIIEVGDETAVGSSDLVFTLIGQTLSFGGGSAVAVGAGGTFTLAHSDGDGYMTVFVVAANLPGQDKTDAISIVSQGIKFTVQYAPTNSYEIQDNLGSVIKVRYMGNGTTCTMSITDSLFSTSVSGATDGSQSLSLDITTAQFDTILELINYINAQTGYVAEASEYLLDSNLSAIELDNVTAVNIKNIDYIITANLGTLISWVNNNSVFLTLEIPEGSTDRDALDPSKIVGYKSLSGGSEGNNTLTEWQLALDMLANEDIDIIVPITTDTAILSLVKEHVDNMNGRKKERRAYYGHALNKSVKEIQNIRMSFNSRHAVLVTPGIKLRDEDGVIKLYDSSYLAAMYAGIAAGFADVAQSLTWKYVNIIGLEKKYSDVEIDLLLGSGVSPVEFVRNKGYRITQGRTTYTLDEKSVNTEDSVSRIADYIQKNVRENLEDMFVGEKATPTTVSSVKSKVVSLLQSYQRSGLITNGVDEETGVSLLAYDNINVSFSNRVCNVTFKVSPVEPMNYIAIVASFRPASIVA